MTLGWNRLICINCTHRWIYFRFIFDYHYLVVAFCSLVILDITFSFLPSTFLWQLGFTISFIIHLNHVFYVWRFFGSDLLGRLKKNSYHPRSLVFGDFRLWNRLGFERDFFLPGHILVMFQRRIFLLFSYCWWTCDLFSVLMIKWHTHSWLHQYPHILWFDTNWNRINFKFSSPKTVSYNEGLYWLKLVGNSVYQFMAIGAQK